MFHLQNSNSLAGSQPDVTMSYKHIARKWLLPLTTVEPLLKDTIYI